MATPVSGFPTLPMPARAVPTGLNYLQDEPRKKSIRASVVELVRLATPSKLGVQIGGNIQVNRDAYADALYAYIQDNPHVLSELENNQKVTYADFSKTDKAYVLQVLKAEIQKLRPTINNTTFRTRLVPDESKGWIEFREKDCFFAALLAALGYRPAKNRVNPESVPKATRETKLETQEKDERETEAWLATQLGVSQRVTPDAMLIYLMEQQFGWNRVADGTKFSELKASAPVPSSYILSYQKSGNSWHVVYVAHPTGLAWNIIDRQATSTGASAEIADNARCDAWLIQATTPGFAELQNAFDNRPV